MNVPLKLSLINLSETMFTVTFSFWIICCLSSTESLVVPQELPSILSLIYSNIPPIKKGTDSRLGFGFRLGNHADFQVLLELGPQKNTRPIGENADSENSFNKRQVSKAQRDYLRRKEVQEALKGFTSNTENVPPTSNEHTAASWLETWSSAMNPNSKSNNNNASRGSKKKYSSKFIQAVAKKDQLPQQSLPAVANVDQSMLQLQKLYQMATTATSVTDITTTNRIDQSNMEDKILSGNISKTTLETERLIPPFVPLEETITEKQNFKKSKDETINGNDNEK